MDTLSYKTISANKATVTKEWVIVDATDQVLGRLGAKVAKLLRGKYKPNFTPHVDCGDNVIIINADKVMTRYICHIQVIPAAREKSLLPVCRQNRTVMTSY